MRKVTGLASWVGVCLLAFVGSTVPVSGQTPPPAPVLSAPANGASVVQPITIQWQAVVDPDGPIGSYSWQVGTSSSFATVIASGFNNFDGDVPLPTKSQVSGLPNGTYFWRVKAAQDQGGAIGFVDSPWSAARSFTVTGLGPAPAGSPAITSPAPNSSFHPVEFFDITWTEVAGAQYYLLEADDDAAFSHPITLGSTIEFGTKFNAGWGNEIPNVFYRVRAVSADNVRGLPSETLTVHITNTAPVPPPPTPLSPINGAAITLPFKFDWTDTPNPQIVGYDIDIDDEPNFLGDVGVLMVTQISRSDYMVVPDPLVEGINHLPPGTYFWRVRAVHGNVLGPWSAGASFKVNPLPATPPGLDLFWILTDPGSVQGGNPTAARIALNMPAPAGGTVVKLASDFPGIEIPASVTIPAGSTDAVVTPVTTVPVSGASISTVRAAFGIKWQQSSIGLFPILWNGQLNAEEAVGGSAVTGTVTLLGPAPPGGAEVTILSSDTSLARPPASVIVPAGATEATFNVSTSAVTAPTRVVFDFGTAFENYRAPGTWLVLNPAGSPAPPPAVSTIALNPTTLVGGATGTGTITLTAPAPAGGMLVKLSGSMEGDVVVPQDVTVPAGLTSADFPITPPRVAQPHWVIIQASEWPNGLLHAATLRVNPGGTGPNPLFAIDVRPNSAIGGTSLLGTVGLSVPAPAGGATVALSSSDPAVAQVPATVAVAAGNSTASFSVTTTPVDTGASVSITGTAGGASKTAFINLGPDPNAPLMLMSITPSVSGAQGGNPINTTLFMNKSAPAGGAVVTLSSSNPAAAQVPASVTVPAGLGFVTFNITTSPVAVDTPVTITGVFNATQKAVITVLAPPGGGGFRGPTANAADTGGDGNGFETGAANAHVLGGGVAVDTNSGTASSTSCTSTARDRHRFFNFGLGVPAGASVAGIEVRVDARADATAGAPKMCVQLSWDGGATWTAAKATPTLTTSLATYILGGVADKWGRTWTSGELTNANLRVRVIDVASSTARDFSLDWIAVRVTTGAAPPPDSTPPSVSVTSPAAGATVSGTVTVTASASDNVGVTRVDFLVDGALLSSDTAAPYSAAWVTSTNGAHSLTARAFDAAGNQTTSAAVSVTVNNGSAPVLDLAMSGVPSSIPRGQFFTAKGTVTNAGGSAASGYSVVISFTPTDSMRLENPQTATQSLPTVAAGGSQSVSWQMRADKAASATLTMKLVDSGGATVDTASQAITVTN